MEALKLLLGLDNGMNTLECIPTTCSSLPHIDRYLPPKKWKHMSLQRPVHRCQQQQQQGLLWTPRLRVSRDPFITTEKSESNVWDHSGQAGWNVRTKARENTLEGYLYTPITRLQAEANKISIGERSAKSGVESPRDFGKVWTMLTDNLVSSHVEPLIVNSLPGLQQDQVNKNCKNHLAI